MEVEIKRPCLSLSAGLRYHVLGSLGGTFTLLPAAFGAMNTGGGALFPVLSTMASGFVNPLFAVGRLFLRLGAGLALGSEVRFYARFVHHPDGRKLAA